MRKELLTYKDPKSPVSEVFRTLRTNIQFMNTNKKLKTLLVTSTFPGEGKSWVTSNLAVTFAQAGKRVILIDADMRKGRQYNIFGVLPKPGLSNYLSNMDAENNETADINISKYIQETDVENLHLLVAGSVPPNPSELLVSSEMIGLLKELKEMCDLIIIDGTPCDLVTDSIILSRIVDSTIIVTAQKETKKDNLTRIVKNIQNVGGKIAGVVVNKVDVSAKKYNDAYYYGSISANKINKHPKKKKDKREIDTMVTHLTKFSEIENDEILDEEKQTIDEDIEKENELLQDIEKIINDNNYETNQESELDNDNTYNTENVENIEKIENIENVENVNNAEEVQSNQEDDQTINENNIEENQELSNQEQEGQEQQNQVQEDNHNLSTAETIEKAESAKDISDEKANEIINLVNSYIKSEKRKQKRGSSKR